MNQKYDYIILPPDSFHTNFNDLLSGKEKAFKDICNEILSLSEAEHKTFLVKYRASKQLCFYPFTGNQEVGYGSFLDYCNKESIIIGPIGSAFIEALGNNLLFFPYDLDNTRANNPLEEYFYISKNRGELLNNITACRVRKKRTKEILFSNAQSLESIVSSIMVN
jgi:hypothetical protein